MACGMGPDSGVDGMNVGIRADIFGEDGVVFGHGLDGDDVGIGELSGEKCGDIACVCAGVDDEFGGFGKGQLVVFVEIGLDEGARIAGVGPDGDRVACARGACSLKKARATRGSRRSGRRISFGRSYFSRPDIRGEEIPETAIVNVSDELREFY